MDIEIRSKKKKKGKKKWTKTRKMFNYFLLLQMKSDYMNKVINNMEIQFDRST